MSWFKGFYRLCNLRANTVRQDVATMEARTMTEARTTTRVKTMTKTLAQVKKKTNQSS